MASILMSSLAMTLMQLLRAVMSMSAAAATRRMPFSKAAMRTASLALTSKLLPAAMLVCAPLVIAWCSVLTR
ncbi:hypothetical protein D9M70_641870 [compost metagenome]